METTRPTAGQEDGSNAREPGQAPPETLTRLSGALRSIDPQGVELSIIEVVLLACDASEDQSEICDLVDGLIHSGAARILPAADDPLLSHREDAQAVPGYAPTVASPDTLHVPPLGVASKP